MAKKNKRKKSAHPNPNGGYKKFLLDLQEALNQGDLNVRLSEYPPEYRRMMYDYRIRIANPEAANGLVSPAERKKITQKTKSYYREKKLKYREEKLSTYQLMLIYCFASVRSKMAEKELGENDPTTYEMKKVSDDALRTFHSQFIVDYFKIISQLSNPAYKYFGIYIRPAAVHKDNPMMQLVIEVYGVPARKLVLEIDGVKRPIYRLGKPMGDQPVEWISVDSSILGGYYKGSHATLEVYIQSHVIDRLSQRLDLLDGAAVNYLIWENTNDIRHFEFHRGYLLLPVKLFEVKVGYLVGKIVDDKLLFRTFLFITHSATPEGDKLAEISGLGKHDITYWRIDRLSSFVNLDEENYQELMDLFQQSGIEGFMKLKEQDFDIDRMQSVNFEGLMDYIRKGKQVRLTE